MRNHIIEGVNVVVVHTVCPQCGAEEYVAVGRDEYDAWESGVHINEAIPWLPAKEKRYIVSGICDYCWDYIQSIEGV